jgi:acylphosphatase
MQTNPNELARVHIWVKGRVQGVGFRSHVEYFAAGIGVSGWVRNIGWDTVEAVAEGLPQQIEQFTRLMKTGPRASRVDEIRVEEEPIEGLQEFVVRRSM